MLSTQVKGYTYATMMLLGLIIGTLCDNQHFQRVVRAGFRLRGVLTHEVFRKVTAVSPQAVCTQLTRSIQSCLPQFGFGVSFSMVARTTDLPCVFRSCT